MMPITLCMQRPRHSRLLAVVTLFMALLFCSDLFAQNRLFVLIENEEQLADRHELINDVVVPVHVIDLGEFDEIRARMSEPLSFIDALNEKTVSAERGRIESVMAESLALHEADLVQSVNEKIVAGEISYRYNVDHLPALIELQSNGNYRLIQSVSSFEDAILELDVLPFRQSPAPMSELARQRAGASRDDPGSGGDATCDPAVDGTCSEPADAATETADTSTVVELCDIADDDNACKTVVMEIAGVEVTVLVDEDVPQSALDDLQSHFDQDEIDQVIADNPDIDLSTPEAQAEFMLQSQLDILALQGEEEEADAGVEEATEDTTTGNATGDTTTGNATGDTTTGNENTAEEESATTEAVSGNETEYSMLDAILDGHKSDSFDCLDLRVTGICLYAVLRVYCYGYYCDYDFSIEGSLQLTHFNPDAVVSSYKRLGDSPIKEARDLFGSMQTKVVGKAVDKLTGNDLADILDRTEMYAAWATDSEHKGSRSTLKYHEVELIGHPGTLYSFMRAENMMPFSQYMDHLTEAPENLVDGLSESFAQFMDSLAQQLEELERLAAQRPDSTIFSASGNGNEVETRTGEGGGGDTSVTRFEMDSGEEILRMVDAMFLDGRLEGLDDFLELYGYFTQLQELWNMDTDTIIDGFADKIMESEEVQEVQQMAEEFQQIADTVNEVAEVASEISGEGTETWSMCPPDSQFLKPYYLSGFDFVAWKFNIPEIIYEETYAPQTAENAHLFVGQPGEGESEENTENVWGSIYPRQGFVSNVDELKASAVAASRGAHLMTRQSQSHVYAMFEETEREFLDKEHPQPFLPNKAETGKWQSLTPDIDDQCVVFGEDDPMAKPWTAERRTKDRANLFALWREYSCCPEPRPEGAMIFIPMKIGVIGDLDIQIID